jgi:exoribonuclease II
MEVMSLDELTVEASVRLLHVLDAPQVTSGTDTAEADEAEEGEEELIDAADDSAESEAEARAEADSADADEGVGNEDETAGDADASPEQQMTEPGR